MRRRCTVLPFTQSLPCGIAWGGGPLGSVEVYDHVRVYESSAVCFCWLGPCSRIELSACKPLTFSPVLRGRVRNRGVPALRTPCEVLVWLVGFSPSGLAHAGIRGTLR